MGAVVAATKVLRILHDSERPLNASEVARAAGLHRGTAYNILRTLQAAGFVGYDEATHSYSLSLHILELAYGVLRRSGLMDLARPLMHAISDAHNVSVYVSKVLGPSSLLLLDWVGVAFRTDLYVTVGRPSPVPAGASGVKGQRTRANRPTRSRLQGKGALGDHRKARSCHLLRGWQCHSG